MTSIHTPHHRLVLADVENLLGAAIPSRQEVVQIRQQLFTLLGDTSDTLFEVACSHLAAPAVRFGFPEGRHQWRSGTDGADLALIGVIADEHVAERFRTVVVASGDGIFAAPVSDLTARGVECTVISRRQSLSNRLRLAATHVVFLDDDDFNEGVLLDAA